MCHVATLDFQTRSRRHCKALIQWSKGYDYSTPYMNYYMLTFVNDPESRGQDTFIESISEAGHMPGVNQQYTTRGLDQSRD